MITLSISKAKEHINDLIKQDKDTDKQSNQYYEDCMLFIKAHLMSFFAKYAKEGNLSISEVSQKASKWDKKQWLDAIQDTDMSEWTNEAVSRVKSYGHFAGIDTRHTIEALIGFAVIRMTMRNHKNIAKRLQKDITNQAHFNDVNLKGLNKSRVKKSVSIITQQSTREIWSQNLWIDSDSLANDIENLVNKHLRHGMSLYDLDNILATHANKKQFKPNQYIGDRVKQMQFNAQRIVRTESSRLIDQVNTSTYMASDVTKVNIVNEPGACLKCQGLAEGGPYSISDAPTIPDDSHPNCRCHKAPAGDSHSVAILGNRLF